MAADGGAEAKDDGGPARPGVGPVSGAFVSIWMKTDDGPGPGA